MTNGMAAPALLVDGLRGLLLDPYALITRWSVRSAYS